MNGQLTLDPQIIQAYLDESFFIHCYITSTFQPTSCVVSSNPLKSEL